MACGEVSRVWQPPTHATWTLSANAQQNRGLLYTAFQQRSLGTLVFSSAVVGVGTKRAFRLQPSGDTCVLSDSTEIGSSA